LDRAKLQGLLRSSWTFLCFTPQSGDQLQAALADLIIATGRGLKVTHIHFPPGVL
jgi:hypothetical protein